MPNPAGEPPILPGPSEGRRKAEEPFEFWLFSRRSLWLKVQAVAAVVLLGMGAGMAVQKLRYDRARDDAYVRVLRAEEERDYLGIIRGIERFLRTDRCGIGTRARSSSRAVPRGDREVVRRPWRGVGRRGGAAR